MSWTTQHTETNAFKVKNVNEVREVFEAMGFATEVTTKDEVIAYAPQGDGLWFDEDTEVVLSKKPFIVGGKDEMSNITIEERETNFVGCLNDCIMETLEEQLEKNNLTEEDVVIQYITEYLQDQLLEGCGISIMDVGFESRCSGNYDPFGGITFITKNTVKYNSLSNIQDEMAKELGVSI